MSRRFDGTDDHVHYPVQSFSNFTAAFSVAVVHRRDGTGSWDALISHHQSSGDITCYFEFKTDNGLVGFTSAAGESTSGWTITSLTDWWILVMTKASGSAQPRFHRKNLTAATAWEHTNGSTNAGNPLTQSGGYISVGCWEDSDHLDGYIAVDAGWGSALSDSEVEELSFNSSTDDWLNCSVAPAYLHQHNQSAAADTIEDLMGNGHDSSDIFGTTMDSGADPPGWTYYTPGGGGGGSSTAGPTPSIAAGIYDAELNPNMWF